MYYLYIPLAYVPDELSNEDRNDEKEEDRTNE